MNAQINLRGRRILIMVMVTVATAIILVTWSPWTQNRPAFEGTPIENPDRTMELDAGGLLVALEDPDRTTVEDWKDPYPEAPSASYDLTRDGLRFPAEASGESGNAWVLVREPEGSSTENSLIRVSRRSDGRLRDIEFRLWDDRVEFAWRSDIERQWTVQWDGQSPRRMAGTSFTHERSADNRQYLFVGTALGEVPDEAAHQSTIVRTVPGRSRITVPGGNREP